MPISCWCIFYIPNDNDWLKFCLIFPYAEIKMCVQLISLNNVLTNLLRWTHVKTSCSFCCFRLFVFLICRAVMMNRIGLNDKFICDLFIWLLLFVQKSDWWQLKELLLLAVFWNRQHFHKLVMHLYENSSCWHAVTAVKHFIHLLFCYSIICICKGANVKHSNTKKMHAVCRSFTRKRSIQ